MAIKDNNQIITISMPKPLVARLDHHAEDIGISRGAMIRMAIIAFLKEKEKVEKQEGK